MLILTVPDADAAALASMRPRGQTPRMLVHPDQFGALPLIASMRPRGQTPRMREQMAVWLLERMQLQ